MAHAPREPLIRGVRVAKVSARDPEASSVSDFSPCIKSRLPGYIINELTTCLKSSYD